MIGRSVWVAVIALAVMVHQPALAKPVPAGAYELCRTLERSLRDGEALIVKRCWDIAFVASGDAMVVQGTQSRVHVDAPPALAPLASIEQQRVDEAMFPALLTADGTMSPDNVGSRPDDLAQVRTAATRMINALRTDPETAASMLSFVTQVSSATNDYLAQVPPDLFYPKINEDRNTMELTLPDGATGSVVVSLSANTREADGLLATARRTIITRAGETKKSSVETWVLNPIEAK